MDKTKDDLFGKSADNILIKISEWYLDNGFSISNKKEVDIQIFKIITENKKDFLLLSDHQISKQLRISITKVNQLKSEIQLRYRILKENDILIEFLEKLTTGLFEVKDNEFSIKIDNPIVRNEVEYILQANNIFYDSSFKNEIISFKQDKLSELLIQLVQKSGTEIEIKQRILEFIKMLKKKTKVKISFENEPKRNDNLQDFLKKFITTIKDNKEFLVTLASLGFDVFSFIAK